MGDWKFAKFQRAAVGSGVGEWAGREEGDGGGWLTGVVGLHALERVDEEAEAGHVEDAGLRGKGAGDAAAGPEGVAHGAPGLVDVCAKGGGAVCADDEAGGEAGEGDVDYVLLGRCRLDVIRGAVGGEGDGAVLCGKGVV